MAGVTHARDELAISPITTKRPKLLLKIAPDLDESQISDIADVVQSSGIDGVIVSNTTVQRPKTLNGREWQKFITTVDALNIDFSCQE